MTPKQQVLKAYPWAKCVTVPVLPKEFYVWTNNFTSQSIGFGTTPAKAWASAAKYTKRGSNP